MDVNLSFAVRTGQLNILSPPVEIVEKMGDKIVPNFSFRSEQRPLTFAFLISDICCFMLQHGT